MTDRSRSPLCSVALVGLLVATFPVLAWGQASSEATAESKEVRRGAAPYTFSGPIIAPGHWSLDAVRRADALGLLAMHLPAQRAVPLEVVEAALREAAGNAPVRAPALMELTREWHARLLEEFSGLAPVLATGEPGLARLGVAAGLDFESRRGAAGPGLGEFEPHRDGALPLPDHDLLVGEMDVAVSLGAHVGARVRPRVSRDGARLEAGELRVGWSNWSAAVGRLPIGYAHGVGGGVTLTGESALDAVGFETRAPVVLPWVLRHLGPVSFTTHFARFREERHPGDPYFWAASGQFQPHRRVTLGIHRAALFGGDHPEPQPVTFGRVVDMLIGRVAGIGFEDQIVSVSGRFHLPTESLIPLTAYLEWGAEDAAGAWWAVPGRVVGLESASLPFWPQVRAGVEYTHFEPSCCSNPQWYRHWSFHGSWAAGDRTLGHPLGGDGREAMAHASAHLLDARLRVSGRAFMRSRREENLFSPGRTGRSTGAAARVAWALSPRTELRLAGGREAGDGWAENSLTAEGRVFF